MIFEVCANSIQSAINAEKGGAHRIELCSGLEIGGVTPSYGLISEAKVHVNIPIHVLIRPRGGNFVYTQAEIDIMKIDIIFCRRAGIAGVVIGVLDNEGQVDEVIMNELIALARPMKVAFHRAFDRAKEPMSALDTIIRTGCDILLTSGQTPKAIDGITLLEKLVQKADGNLEIMPGSGVNVENVVEIVEKTGATAVHFSGKEIVENENVFLKGGFEESGRYWETSEDNVRRVVDLFV